MEKFLFQLYGGCKIHVVSDFSCGASIELLFVLVYCCLICFWFIVHFFLHFYKLYKSNLHQLVGFIVGRLI